MKLKFAFFINLYLKMFFLYFAIARYNLFYSKKTEYSDKINYAAFFV